MTILKAGAICGALLLVPSVVFAQSPVSSTFVTPKSVERMLVEYGPRGTVQRLTKGAGETDLGDYDKVLDGVSKGDPRWIALVPKLEPGTDADSAESLGIAVASALPKNPAAVLRLISVRSNWLKACTYPMIEPTTKDAKEYFDAAIPAVKSVRDSRLQLVKRRCLMRLIASKRMP